MKNIGRTAVCLTVVLMLVLTPLSSFAETIRNGYLLPFDDTSFMDTMTRERFENGETALDYRLYLPEEIADEPCALLLFLHGAGQRGDDNEKQLYDGAVASFFASGIEDVCPTVVVAPQCPEDARWVETDWEDGAYSVDEVPESVQLRAVRQIIDGLLETYPNIDANRLYVTGLSMGGFGTWDLITRTPDVFAAAMPVCGSGDPSKGEVLAASKTAVAAFHNRGDGVVPVSGTLETVNAIVKAGGSASCTVYEVNAHDAWTRTYANIANWNWLFSHVLGKEPYPGYEEPEETLTSAMLNLAPYQPVTEPVVTETEPPETIPAEESQPLPETLPEEEETRPARPQTEDEKGVVSPVPAMVSAIIVTLAAAAVIVFAIRVKK